MYKMEPSYPNERAENKRLCDLYPFLIPRNSFSGKRIDCKEPGFWPGDPDKIPEWNYDYTALDEMPDGWRKAFGEQMCAEIKQALIEEGLLDDYRITQIKEKYGCLRWYSNFSTRKVEQIINKYAELSLRTCIICGAPATRLSKGWICPYCDRCADPNEEFDELII